GGRTPIQGRIMTQQTVAGRTNSVLAGTHGAAPEFAVRFTGALLAVAVAAVHVADQGGITAMASPAWIGWGYRLIESGRGNVCTPGPLVSRSAASRWRNS